MSSAILGLNALGIDIVLGCPRRRRLAAAWAELRKVAMSPGETRIEFATRT
jgi:hypothetical protein